jgi:hypothetical protein
VFDRSAQSNGIGASPKDRSRHIDRGARSSGAPGRRTWRRPSCRWGVVRTLHTRAGFSCRWAVLRASHTLARLAKCHRVSVWPRSRFSARGPSWPARPGGAGEVSDQQQDRVDPAVRHVENRSILGAATDCAYRRRGRSISLHTICDTLKESRTRILAISQYR